jgi:hypothetical protein
MGDDFLPDSELQPLASLRRRWGGLVVHRYVETTEGDDLTVGERYEDTNDE